MFDFAHAETIREITTRDGDHWTVVPGSLEFRQNVLRFKTHDGKSVQVHVASVASITSEDQ